MKPVSAFENFPPFASAGSRTAPGDAKYATGFVPADTFPAEWSNYLFYKSSKCATDLNSAVRSLWLELASILTDYNITADASETDQILTALKKIYPQVTTCATLGSTQDKALAISGGVLKTGNIYSITMTHGNTYGDGDSTYPTMSLNSGTAYPMCDAGGNYLASGAWEDGEVINVLFNGSKFLMATRSPVDKIENNNMRPVTSNAVSVIAASSTTITGPKIGIGATVKIMFTADIAGSDTSTALSITYNGTAYTVKVAKNGSLSNITAHEVSTGVYKYLQAYTTLELIFDGTNFIVLGNPVVLSSDDYVIYSDGFNSIHIPDWDNAKKLTVTNSDFVISDFGLIVGSFYSNQNRTYLVVNGVNVSCAGNINNSFGWDGQVQLEVRQGDIIKFSSTQYAIVNIWFVPYKQY